MAKTKSPKATKTAKVSKTASNVGLFSGRLNRSGFVLGYLSLFFTAVVFAMIFAPLAQKISNGFVLVFFSILILCYTVCGVSFILRRLHDLNRNGLWLLIFLPGFLLILIATGQGISSGLLGAHNSVTQTLFATTQSQNGSIALLGLLSAVANLFYIYLVAWPGYKKVNKWGPPSTHWKLKEILGFK